MINTFHNDYPEKPIALFLPIDFAPPMTKPSLKPLVKTLKYKRG